MCHRANQLKSIQQERQTCQETGMSPIPTGENSDEKLDGRCESVREAYQRGVKVVRDGAEISGRYQ